MGVFPTLPGAPAPCHHGKPFARAPCTPPPAQPLLLRIGLCKRPTAARAPQRIPTASSCSSQHTQPPTALTRTQTPHLERPALSCDVKASSTVPGNTWGASHLRGDKAKEFCGLRPAPGREDLSAVQPAVGDPSKHRRPGHVNSAEPDGPQALSVTRHVPPPRDRPGPCSAGGPAPRHRTCHPGRAALR